jgi:hypothetical protein
MPPVQDELRGAGLKRINPLPSTCSAVRCIVTTALGISASSALEFLPLGGRLARHPGKIVLPLVNGIAARGNRDQHRRLVHEAMPDSSRNDEGCLRW